MNPVPGSSEVTLNAPQRRRYILAAIIIPSLIVAELLWLRGEFRQTDTLRAEVTASHDRRVADLTLQASVSAAETAQRGYLLTGNPALLDPLEPARRGIAEQMSILLTAPGEAEPQRIHRIDRLVQAMRVELDRTIASARTGRGAEAMASVSTGTARQIMDSLSREIDAAIDSELRFETERQRAFDTQRARAQDNVLFVIAIAIAATLALLVSLWSAARKRHLSLVEAFATAQGSAGFFDSTIGAVLILSPTGKIEVMNAAAVALLGFFASAADKLDISTVVDIAPGEGSFHTRLGLIDGQLQRTQLIDRMVQDLHGNNIPVDIALGVMHAPSGDRIVVSLRDISERKRLDQAKDDLMSTVSHEIGTPLTSIVGSLGLLRAGVSGDLPPEASRLVTIAENNSRRLIRLINDMLDIDRIESGKFHLALEPIDVRDVLERACIGSEGKAKSDGVTLSCKTPDAPIMVSGDADRLLQVISNLMSNAIRAAPAGSTVDLALSVTEAGSACVSIDDRGSGVPLAFRTRIFGRFERAEHDDSTMGTGLGLAISREIVIQHGGRIWFEDREGGGTRFAFTLALLGGASDGEKDKVLPHVLLCCAAQEACDSLAAMVGAEGGTCTVTRSVPQAQAAVASEQFALLILDLDLPDQGALNFAVSTHAAGTSPADVTPILLVSTQSADDDDGLVCIDLVEVIEGPLIKDRLHHALLCATARSGRRRPVILHLAEDCDRLALVALVAATLEPEVRVITARDVSSAQAIAKSDPPDVVVLDIDPANAFATVLPALVDQDGVAIPTILYTTLDLAIAAAGPKRPLVIGCDGARPDLAATVRRVLRYGVDGASRRDAA